MSTPVYLDYNASTPCDDRVLNAMMPYWTMFGNPHSNHGFGKKKQQVIYDCITSLSTIYNCFCEEILFTSGATEANNLAIFSGLKLAMQDNPSANIVLTSHLEHKSVNEPLRMAASKLGLNLVYANITPNGVIDVEWLQKYIVENQVLWLSLCMTNGEIGSHQPIDIVANFCEQNGIILHVDASQAGYQNIDLMQTRIDYFVISGHKIYASVGIGLLISRHLGRVGFKPMIFGGGQQDNVRSGTLPVPLIVGLTKACEIIKQYQVNEVCRITELRNLFFAKLQNGCEVKLHGHPTNRHPGNLHIAILGSDALELSIKLQDKVAFSLGSACNGLNRQYSPLLKEMGVSQIESQSSIRLCIGRMTTKSDVITAIEWVLDAIN